MIGVENLQGHWQRAWLKAPGFADHDTCVHWMQCGPVYADVRIPRDRPDVRGARSLDELSTEALSRLMRAEGFAGDISVEDGVCTWHRVINWHGAPATVDAGHLSFEGNGSLTETGVHADYAELWHRIEDTPDEALRLRSEDGGIAFLVTVGRRFVFGIGRPGATPSTALIEALAAGVRAHGLAGHFEQVHALGHWERGVGIADLATNPLIEGTPLLTWSDGGVVWHSVDFAGLRRDVFLAREGLEGAAA